MNNFDIAIDGPAGSGKSTIAKLLAKELGFIYVDTGSMYRAVALYCMRRNIEISNTQQVSSALDHIDISIMHYQNEQRIFLNGEDVTQLVRLPDVSSNSSLVAAIKEVREKLVHIQRKIAENNDIVMDGRDIGTHVLPHAKVKIYLDANVEERARRRSTELKQKNIEYDYQMVKVEIVTRDYNDTNREISPLKKAPDAIVVDTSGLEIQAVFNRIMKIVKDKMAQ